VRVNVGGREVALSNLDKVLYPSGFTKGEVVHYYTRIAPALLPHLTERPLTLKRYPNGVEAGHFYEKRCPSYRPDWFRTASIWSDRHQTQVPYCIVDDVASLVWVANTASLELHTSLSHCGDMPRPTMVVFDLDPGEPAGIQECAWVALELRRLLDVMGLQTFVKTSGSKGLQAYVPLNSPVTYDGTKRFSKTLAVLLERHYPDRVVSNMKKELRVGKVLVDWSQNDESKTTVSVYSLRAKARPTVSTPVTWEEVERLAEGADPAEVTFEADEVLDRVDRVGDLFAPVADLVQELPRLDQSSIEEGGLSKRANTSR
jgi:bifunctional non-homologous end joining protein LigD